MVSGLRSYLTLILTLCLSQGLLGEVPGMKSIKKCYEYYNIGLEIPALKQLTEEDIKLIQQEESDFTPATTNPSVVNRIFAGGVDAKPKQLPFIAALGYENGKEKGYFCGGSLISERFVLTAAHCIFSREWGRVKYVRLGDLNLTSSTDDAGVQEVRVRDHYVHPNYSHPRRYHDIALLRLQKPVTFSDYVKPICLEAKREALHYRTFYGAGWGIVGFGERESDHLQVGQLKHYSLETCRKTYTKDLTLPDGIDDRLQLCAGAITHIADTCEGDSGGPLVYGEQFPPMVYYLAGVTSFGKACALAKLPGVYVRVSHYTEWIEKIVWPDATSNKNQMENYSDIITFPE